MDTWPILVVSAQSVLGHQFEGVGVALAAPRDEGSGKLGYYDIFSKSMETSK